MKLVLPAVSLRHEKAPPFPRRADEPAPTRELRDLNKSYFPFTPVKDKAAWDVRREHVRNRLLLASGLWPMPGKTPLNAVVHGRIERDDYTVEKVFFESHIFVSFLAYCLQVTLKA